MGDRAGGGGRRRRASLAGAGTATYTVGRFGNVRLLQALGTAGNCELYRGLWCKGAHSPELMCVVKRLGAALVDSPTFVAMFEEEARVLAQLEHPNIVRLFESGHATGMPYLVFEWLDGLDLRRVSRGLRKEGRVLPVEVAVHVAREVALGLAHAHAARDAAGQPMHLVHRDLRPDNIVLLRDGRVKLGEFGVARASSFISLSVTLAGISREHPVYLAPEQVTGAPLDARTDLFALGAVLWEMLTNQPLFPPASPRAAADRVVACEVTPPSRYNAEVSPELDALVLRLLSRTPARRPASATEVAQRLGVLLPAPADAVRGLGMLVRASIEVLTPAPAPAADAAAPVHPFTLSLSGPHPGLRDPSEPTTEIDLAPAGLAAASDEALSAALAPRPPRRRRFVSLLRIGGRNSLLMLVGGLRQRLRALATRPRT